MKLLLYLTGIIFLISGCQVLNPKSGSSVLENTTWMLVSINQKPVNPGDKAFIKFDTNGQRASGKAVCNSFFAAYAQVENKISFSSVGSTKMYCEGVMDTENQIITNLQNTSRFEVKSDMLNLYSSDELLLSFKR